MKKTHLRTGFFALLIITAVTLSGTGLSAKEAKVSPESTKFLSQLSNALDDVAATAGPAVVNISTTTTITMEQSPFGEMFNDPLFRRFFGEGNGRPGQKKKQKSSALGSGVIVSENGYILTNNHVVQDADEIKIVLSDKREFKGKIVGSDPKTDLAVVKIDAKDLPTIQIGSSSKLKTGDVVLAIGNPFGLNQTITMGIVSAVGRSNVGIADYEDFIQTDAAINPGNSGGALVNTSGQLVGINTAIFSTSGGYMGIGFAIPLDMAKTVMDSIIKTGKVTRGWLGVSIQNITPDLAKSLGIKDTSGALVSGVMRNSPAEKAGIKRGDIITELDGKTIEDSRILRNMVADNAPGKTVTVTVLRKDKKELLKVTLGEFQDTKVAKKADFDFDNLLKDVVVQDLTPDLRERLNIPADITGVVVAQVAQDNPALNALQQGDVIMELERKPVANVKEYSEIVSKIGAKDGVLMLVYRDGATIFITLRP
jgi:serine protease Do